MADNEQFEPNPNKRGEQIKANDILTNFRKVREGMGLPPSSEKEAVLREMISGHDSADLGDFRTATEEVIGEIISERRAKQTKALHASGVLGKSNQDSTHHL